MIQSLSLSSAVHKLTKYQHQESPPNQIKKLTSKHKVYIVSFSTATYFMLSKLQLSGLTHQRPLVAHLYLLPAPFNKVNYYFKISVYKL